MTFEELQELWNNQPDPKPRSQDELRAMMYQVPPHVRRMRKKLIIESAALTAFVIVVIIVADLLSGPLWLALAFIACNAFYLFNDLLCYQYLKHTHVHDEYVQSLVKLGQQMRMLIILSCIAGVLMGGVVVLILVLKFQVNADNLILWSTLIPLLIFITWLVTRNWVWRANEVKEMLEDMDMDMDEDEEIFD